jgi:hypothetical protein
MNIETLTTHASYIGYMKRVASMITSLPYIGQQEIQGEINSHIYESLRTTPGLSVDEALQRFGEPDTYLPEWVAVKKMEIATGSFGPIRIFKALLLGIRNHSTHAIKYIAFAILYVLTFSFGALCILKIIFPSHTGLLISRQGFTFGFNSDIVGAQEVLGWWFLPICLFITILLYVIITILLKTSLRKTGPGAIV